jgi:hypothetical protein
VGAKPSEDRRNKGGGKRAVLLVAACPQDFVQGASREAAARQCPVDRCNSKGQDPMCSRCRPLYPPDTLAKLCEKILSVQTMPRKHLSPDHVLFLFCLHFCQ